MDLCPSNIAKYDQQRIQEILRSSTLECEARFRLFVFLFRVPRLLQELGLYSALQVLQSDPTSYISCLAEKDTIRPEEIERLKVYSSGEAYMPKRTRNGTSRAKDDLRSRDRAKDKAANILGRQSSHESREKADDLAKMAKKNGTEESGVGAEDQYGIQAATGRSERAAKSR